jgi:DNA-binding CsgD family transcriptional regulator
MESRERLRPVAGRLARSPASTRGAVLVVALQPLVTRRRAEAALALLLGPETTAVDDALAVGLLRLVGDSLELVDVRLGRVVVAGASEQQLRWTHLALAGVDPLAAAAPQERSDPRSHISLTLQESAVAELAATGVPTREIARRVVLSPKTVEFHLTHVYRKLGVRSKAELAYRFRSVPETSHG